MMNFERNWPPLIAAYTHGIGEGAPEVIWISDPVCCNSCRRVTCFFVNRWGRTLCYACDHKAELRRKGVQ